MASFYFPLGVTYERLVGDDTGSILSQSAFKKPPSPPQNLLLHGALFVVLLPDVIIDDGSAPVDFEDALQALILLLDHI